MRNPTIAWKRDERIPIVVDLARGSLCGVQPGEDAEGLSSLGPGERRKYFIQWPRLGLWIKCSKKGVLESFGAVLRPEAIVWKFAGDAFSGTIILGDGRALAADSSEEDVHRALGEPYWRCDGDELALFYEIYSKRDIEIVLGFECLDARTTRLSDLIVQTPPILSLPKARDWVGMPRPQD